MSWFSLIAQSTDPKTAYSFIDAIKDFGPGVLAFVGTLIAFGLQKRTSAQQRQFEYTTKQMELLYFPLMMKLHIIRMRHRHQISRRRFGRAWANSMKPESRPYAQDFIAISQSSMNIHNYYNDLFFSETINDYAAMEKLIQDHGTFAEPGLLKHWHLLAAFVEDHRLSIAIVEKFDNVTAKNKDWFPDTTPQYPGPYIYPDEADVKPLYDHLIKTYDDLNEKRNAYIRHQFRFWNPSTWKPVPERTFPDFADLNQEMSEMLNRDIKRMKGEDEDDETISPVSH